jgi:tetratricopeptide (TPR) repeat protein
VLAQARLEVFMLHRPRVFRSTALFGRVLATIFFLQGFQVVAADLEAARKVFLSGKYQQCIDECEKISADDSEREDWKLLHADALLTIGKYPEAETVISNALVHSENSIRLRLLGTETAKRVGNVRLSQTRLMEINNLARERIWSYRDAANIVALGRAALLMNADPKTVLERFFSTAQKADSNLREAWIASGELALDKHDFKIAANTFSEAQKKFPDDANILCGLAKAYEPSDRGHMMELVQSALEKNENHVPTLLLLADHLIDAEQYTETDKMLDRVLKVNPWQPEAWAYRAVLAHLRNDSTNEATARDNGLKFWKTNPEVDHLIGLKLSQKYRFTEGSAHQRRALSFDPNFEPARIQLAEDLLRLGDETEGWSMADAAHRSDEYDVTAYNLVTLGKAMQKFATISNENFVIRMAANEAPLYGDRALALLEQAKARLTAKYGINIATPTYVEIFPEQKDFGVRTFGMPHNPGFLGVCFGRVVTANSPASAAGNAANWEAVLWHEFTHVITLQLTKNKMPRWLSEGISVYEELQANPAWGQRMNPRYREMVLGEDLTPVGQLSAAFLTPKSEMHVQFAYYESELVVEFLVNKFGFEKLTAILRDLGNGIDINEAISKNTAPMKELEKQFAEFAKTRAEALGPGLDWKKPATNRRGDILTSIEEQFANPRSAETNSSPAPAGKNYYSLLSQARRLLSEKKWSEAKAPLQTLIDSYPEQSGPNNAYSLLAAVSRNLNETNAERAALEKWAVLDDSALDAYLRLMELAESAKEWNVVSKNADRYLAVDPLVPQPYRFLARASDELGKRDQAVSAYSKLLLLDPPDPADVHFRLAKLLREKSNSEAKRHVLQALEEAPRFREAHRLLLELVPAQTTNSVRSTQ